MSHPQIEEISDSDSDPSIDDPTSFLPSASSSRQPPSTASSPFPPDTEQYLQPQFQPRTTNNPEAYKHYQCLYPLYFDSSRTRAQGRRVGKEQAVANPLARTIVDAVASLGLQTVFEPGKMHPKDWANPGRVRVLLKDENGISRHRRIRNKHHLYIHISTYLQQHPTTASSPLRLRIQGMPMPEKPVPAPAVPRGWKLNEILPLH
ncbi:MAG: hypothetical protein Q9201_002093, partial [Fulgogasparrea decipioides]